MIHYDIDITENGYDNFNGSVDTIDDLREILFYANAFPDCVGQIKTNNSTNSVLCISAVKEFGVYIGISNASGEYLSLFDSELLEEVVDVWGDGLLVSRGLFVPAELAWSAIEHFVVCGNPVDNIHWIRPSVVPENGNYIL